MYVQKVRIENVRGFSLVDLDLTRPDGSFSGWTVLAGRNGSGKSTFLKAVALAVAGFEAAQKLRETYSDWIRTGQTLGNVTVWLPRPETPDDPTITARLTWQQISAPEIGSDVNRLVGRPEPLLSGFSDLMPSFGPGLPLDKSLFLVGYGPYRRLSGHASDVQRLMAGPGTIAGLVSLFREEASLVECVQWLREIYLRRLELRPGAAELEQAVLRLLNDGLLPGNVKVEEIDSNGLWVNQNGVRLSLDGLSDGYRTMAALVMDIVRHLHRTFGELRIEPATDGEGSFERVLHPGIVLIDEVDLHLHVSWQKRIGFWLKRHFPEIQFIVTTHSPFVCQAADPKGLIRLPASGEDRLVEHVSEELYYTVVNGSADDAVLTELFGLDSPYSQRSEKLREDVAQLEAKLQTGTATKKDEQTLDELSSQLPQTPTAAIEQALRKLTA